MRQNIMLCESNILIPTQHLAAAHQATRNLANCSTDTLKELLESEGFNCTVSDKGLTLSFYEGDRATRFGMQELWVSLAPFVVSSELSPEYFPFPFLEWREECPGGLHFRWVFTSKGVFEQNFLEHFEEGARLSSEPEVSLGAEDGGLEPTKGALVSLLIYRGPMNPCGPGELLERRLGRIVRVNRGSYRVVVLDAEGDYLVPLDTHEVVFRVRVVLDERVAVYCDFLRRAEERVSARLVQLQALLRDVSNARLRGDLSDLERVLMRVDSV